MLQEYNRKSVTFTLKRELIQEDQKAYFLEVPFELPTGTEEIKVNQIIQPNGPGKCVVDLGIKDQARIRGWTGSAITKFTLGKEKATPGYIPGELKPGSWAILLGAYRIPEAGVSVTLEIECVQEFGRWLKGDLHMHTVHSDGKFTLADNARIMEALGCDFLAMTDHNTVSQNYAYPRDTNIVMIPGMELTTNFGHSNFLGIADPEIDFRVNDIDALHSCIRQARSKGSKIVLNHPHCPNCGWLFGFDVEYDWVEVWNGPWTGRNQATLEWWHEQLVAGKRLVAVGGSDTHGPHPYVKHAMPTTWVYSAARTVQGVLSGIDKGHVFLSYSPDGPTIDMTCGDCMIGDVVEYVCLPDAAEAAIELTVNRLRAEDLVKIISDRGVEQEVTIVSEHTLQLHWAIADRLFYRVEVWRFFTEADQLLLAGMSNPIYFR